MEAVELVRSLGLVQQYLLVVRAVLAVMGQVADLADLERENEEPKAQPVVRVQLLLEQNLIVWGNNC